MVPNFALFDDDNRYLQSSYELTEVAETPPRALGNLARVALSLVLFQVVIGVINVLGRLPVEVTALHSAVATLLLLVTVLLTRASIVRPAGAG